MQLSICDCDGDFTHIEFRSPLSPSSFMAAAMSTHGPGTTPQGPGQYSSAFFQASDDKTATRSASASTDPRDSSQPPAAAAPLMPHQISTTSTPITAGPFAFKPNVRLAPFPSPVPYRLDDHGTSAALARRSPSELEVSQSLMRLSSSVEPISATYRDQYSHYPPSLPAPPVGNGLMPTLAPVTAATHIPIPKNESDRSPHSSTPPEENAAGRSDVFSAANGSDTISDFDAEPGSILPTQAHLQFTTPANFVVQESAPRTAQSTPLELHEAATNALPAPALQLLPFERHGDGANRAIEAGNGNVEQSRIPASPMYHKFYDSSVPVSKCLPADAGHLPTHGTHCTCQIVCDEMLRILDTPDGQMPNAQHLAKLYKARGNDLCAAHKKAYMRVLTNAAGATTEASTTVAVQQPTEVSQPQVEEIPEIPEVQEPLAFDHKPVVTGSGTVWRPAPYRKRATSITGLYEYEFDLPPSDLPPTKRPRLNANSEPSFYESQPSQRTAGIKYSPRPQVDPAFDEGFRKRVLGELAHNFSDLDEEEWCRGEYTNRYIHAILSRCKHPNTDPRKGIVDAGFLSGQEAADAVESGLESIPIFTEGQQQFQWKEGVRPMAQFFSRMEDLTREAAVQIPSHSFDVPSYQTKTLSEIQDRFFSESTSPDPWNILDLRSPLPPSILPSFLTGENCQLLPRIRDSLLDGQSAERTKANREDWNSWTDLLEWVLMSEGGHNTAPHMDSHGWSTWITIQEGYFGFGWLSRPTDKEREAWMADPLAHTGGNWRFAILKPGQTVFFPSGTIHFVFRLHDKQTLALGGHLLQWTALDRWIEVILWQLKNPNITNEDLGKSPLKYIHIARNLVQHRMKTFRIHTMGGMPPITNFMARASVSYTAPSFT